MTSRLALVENDLPTNRALARLLRISGYTVDAYISAEQFLEQLPHGRPACLIADVDLDGMSGVELQALLKTSEPGLPVIVITGRCDPEAQFRAQAFGCSSFLSKPVRARALLDAVLLALAGRRPS